MAACRWGRWCTLSWSCSAIFQPADGPAISGLGGWLLLDPLGKLVLGFLSVLFFLCSLYAPGYLALRPDRPNRVFCANLFVMLAMMTLGGAVAPPGADVGGDGSDDPGQAPLIYFNHNARSLEATWKYLLIGSVGIALALLGSFFLAYASLKAGLESTLALRPARQGRPAACRRPGCTRRSCCSSSATGPRWAWRPMHTWKPDAYGEAPGIVGTLLAGGVTSCAFLAILRVYQICRAGADAEFAREIMVFMGLLSMAVRRRLHGPPARLQAHAGLLQRRAHGHPGPGHRHRRPGRLRGPAAPDQQRPDQRRAVPLGGQHPPGLRQQAHRRRAGGHRARASLGRRCSWPASSPSPARRRSARS